MHLFRVAAIDIVSHNRCKVHRHVRHGQTGQVDWPGDRLPDELGELRGVFMLGVAVAHHHQQPLVAQRPREVPQQENRRSVGPVRVVEDHHERGLTGDLAEQPRDGLELAKTVLSPCGDLRRRLRTAEQFRRQPREVGVDIRNGHEIGRAAKDLTPRPVRRRAFRLDSDPKEPAPDVAQPAPPAPPRASSCLFPAPPGTAPC